MSTPIKRILFATLPAALIGIWNLGVNMAPAEEVAAGSSAEHIAAFARGITAFLPLLLTALVVSRLWVEAFARLRGKPLDPNWLLAAWLFAVMAPPSIPIPFVVLALSFGLVFGSFVFGGAGHYIVSPSLVGVVFVAIAYPPLVADLAWIPGTELMTSWAFVNEAGVVASSEQGIALAALMWGLEVGAVGTTSTVACLAGALYLLLWRTASARVVIGGLAGLVLASALVGELPWAWHLALGQFAFALAFVATDSTTEPATPGGAWAFGITFGVLTVLLRTADPSHPEGTWSALLLASLSVPLLDHVARSWRARPESQQGSAHD